MGQFLDIDVLNYSIKSLSKMIDITFLKKKQLFDVTPESYRLFDSVTDDPNDKLTVVANNVTPIAGQVTSDTVRAVTKIPTVYQVGAEVIHIDEVLVPKFDSIKGITADDLTALKAETQDDRYEKYISNILFVIDDKSMEFYDRDADTFTTISSGSGSGIEHIVLTKAEYETLLANNKVKDNVIYIIKDDDSSNDYALKEDVYSKKYVTIYTACQSTDAGALEVVADGSIIDATIQVELTTVQLTLPTASVGDYVLAEQKVEVTNTPLFVKVTEIMDTLNSTYTDRPLSAYQGYVLAQKFMKDVYITSNNVLTVESLNGDTFTYDLTSFLQGVIKSIGYGKMIACDELPTCVQNSDGTYTVTYKKDTVKLTCTPENTWFYYKVEEKDGNGNVTSTSWYQTLFIDGVEVSILAGAIADTIKIDEKTKTWILNGKDTEIPAQGVSPTVSENADNTDLVYKLDINYYDATKPRVDSDGNPVYESDGTTQKMGMNVTLTTQNLKGKDDVQVPLNGFYKVYVENGTLVCEVETGATPPPLALENISGKLCLTYTMGGTIQGTKI